MYAERKREKERESNYSKPSSVVRDTHKTIDAI